MNGTGLLAVFAAAVTPLVPTEPVLLGMGAQAAAHHAHIAAVIPVAATGCCISDHILYLAARLAGPRTTGLIPRGAAADRLVNLLSRWGLTGLVIGRWLPGGGTTAALVAGALRWPLSRFTPASALGCTLWSTYATLLGYLGGAFTGRPILGTVISIAAAAAVAIAAQYMLRGHVHRPSGLPGDRSRPRHRGPKVPAAGQGMYPAGHREPAGPG